jgi:xanthine dehydrogenase YagT iron-sulfur-binding subunit
MVTEDRDAHRWILPADEYESPILRQGRSAHQIMKEFEVQDGSMRDDELPSGRSSRDGLTDQKQTPSESIQLRRGAPCDWPISRREFVVGAGAAVGVSTLFPAVTPAGPVRKGEIEAVAVKLSINGEHRELSIDPRMSLLDLLREEIKLTGTKKGCDHGQCGACTILVEGRRINSCLALAVSHDGAQITTIEGLAKGETLDPVQQAFLEHDGYQCGYCTPGQILSAVALIEEAHQGAPSFVTANLRKTGPVELTDDEIRERMSGNICRCGAYPGIVAAVRQAYGMGSNAKALTGEFKGESSAAV